MNDGYCTCYVFLLFVFVILLIMSIFKGKYEQQQEGFNFFKNLLNTGSNVRSTPGSNVRSTPGSSVKRPPGQEEKRDKVSAFEGWNIFDEDPLYKYRLGWTV